MKRSILIDLTSLLDVILILMYLVLSGASMQVENARAIAAVNNALVMHIKELREENEALSRKAVTSLIIEQNCSIITIFVDNDGFSRTVIVENKQTGTTRVDINWEDRQYIRNVLKTDISRKIKFCFESGFQAVFIAFLYDRNKIYQSDYKLISSVIQAEKSNQNIYFAEYDISEGEEDGKGTP